MMQANYLILQQVNGYTIPPGHQVCVSPTVNQKLKEVWTEPEVFNPDRLEKVLPLNYKLLSIVSIGICYRFLDDDAANSEKFAYVPFGAGKTSSHKTLGHCLLYATTHRCIYKRDVDRFEKLICT